MLAPGGVLLYATCSILEDENAAQVDAFLARTPDAVSSRSMPASAATRGAGRQRLPGEDGDGRLLLRAAAQTPER